MKVKTSLTLSEELLAAIAEREGASCNRSEFIEHAAWEYLKRKAREEAEDRELAKLNETAEKYNAEIEDMLRYAAPITFERDE